MIKPILTHWLNQLLLQDTLATKTLSSSKRGAGKRSPPKSAPSKGGKRPAAKTTATRTNSSSGGRNKSRGKSGAATPQKPHNKNSALYFWRKRIIVLFMLGGIILLLVGGAYLYFLNYRVVNEFQGKRWELPARVYSRPLELYDGLPITHELLAAEIAALRYSKGFSPTQPGSWDKVGDRYRLATRQFVFWDGEEQSIAVDFQIDNNRITQLRHAVNGKSLGLVRLDPAQIASIYPLHQEDRALVKLDQVPDTLIKGLIAVEDRRFYQHYGVDPRAIFRAMLVNVKAKRWAQGGSTLTQQLVKNFYLNKKQTLWRKLNEAYMSLMLELHFNKDDILETYINEIYMGQDGAQGVHGLALAAQFYFDKELQQISVAEQAFLIGVLRGASYYNPRRHPQRALAVRNQVLKIMADSGVIATDLYHIEKDSPLVIATKPLYSQTRYPAFIDLVRRQLRQDYREEDIRSEGLQVFTTLAPGTQQIAERALAARVKQFNKETLEAALVITRTGSSEVIALAGGKQAQVSGFNRALDANRQIGSLIKPVVFLTALEQPAAYSLTTELSDEPFVIDDERGQVWEPQNYDRASHGQVLLIDALARSYNIAAARLGLDLGVHNVLKSLHSLGFERQVNPYPSVLLGAIEMSPFEVAQLYQTFATGGFRMPLRAIREVLDVHRKPLSRYPIKVEQVADPSAVYLLNRALQEVVLSGTGRALQADFGNRGGVAGKTGTTNDLRDSWFAGFSGDKMGVVWVGQDDNSSTGLTGSSGAMRVWGDIMSLLPQQPLQFVQPDNIVHVWVDTASGMPSDSSCRTAIEIPFVADYQPTGANSCKGVKTNRVYDWMRGVFQER